MVNRREFLAALPDGWCPLCGPLPILRPDHSTEARASALIMEARTFFGLSADDVAANFSLAEAARVAAAAGVSTELAASAQNAYFEAWRVANHATWYEDFKPDRTDTQRSVSQVETWRVEWAASLILGLDEYSVLSSSQLYAALAIAKAIDLIRERLNPSAGMWPDYTSDALATVAELVQKAHELQRKGDAAARGRRSRRGIPELVPAIVDYLADHPGASNDQVQRALASEDILAPTGQPFEIEGGRISLHTRRGERSVSLRSLPNQITTARKRLRKQ